MGWVMKTSHRALQELEIRGAGIKRRVASLMCERSAGHAFWFRCLRFALPASSHTDNTEVGLHARLMIKY